MRTRIPAAPAACPQLLPNSMSLFRHAAFEISIAEPKGLPPPNGAEIAFAGRSNAGKSSAINTLAAHTRLAYVSKTPGRTQLINFFRLRNGAVLVDLPGYGCPRGCGVKGRGCSKTIFRNARISSAWY